MMTDWLKINASFVVFLSFAALLCPQLDGAADFEERRLIRAALRDLLKKKRGASPCPNLGVEFFFPLVAPRSCIKVERLLEKINGGFRWQWEK